MSFIPIDEVIVPEERIRREFDPEALEELAHSIARLGLMHAIVLRDDGKTLVSGERRLKAHRILLDDEKAIINESSSLYAQRFARQKEVAYQTMGELTDEQLLEAELEENVIRKDLSWQEQARAQAALHNLRIKQHGEYSKQEQDGWSVKKTAEEIVGHEPSGSAQKTVSDAIFLDNFLDDPLVANAPSKKEALKVIADLEKARERKQKADNWDPAQADHTCLQGDCYSIFSTLVVEESSEKYEVPSFDCIIADPPYGRAMDKHTFANRHKYDDSREIFLKFINEFPVMAREITKPQAHAYMFHDIRDFEKSMIAWEIGGWKVWPWPLIWDKGNVGSYGAADQGPRHVYDAILFANKGDRPCIMMQRDVINITQDTTLPHPAGKPIELYAELLKRSTEPGDYILDPMCGGGTIFPAASRLKLHATGIELDEKYYHMSIEMAMEGK